MTIRYSQTPLLGLAPMAGYTDWPMRVLAYRMGANYACSEMISTIGLMCAKPQNETYQRLLYVHPEETNTACQLFGRDPVLMGEAAARVTELGRFTSIDINMGCPARKVVSSGEGSALLLEPELARCLMETVKRNTTLPVTVKTRLGYEDGEHQAWALAHAAEAAGMKWICLHGRTRRQQYAGVADWEAIARLRAEVSIPVIANGDVVDGESAVRILDITGCSGLMIARAAIGNPWVFQQAKCAMEGETYVLPTLRERIETALLQADWMVASKGERIGVCEMRSHVGHYIAGLRGAAAVRKQINQTGSLAELKRLLLTLIEDENAE